MKKSDGKILSVLTKINNFILSIEEILLVVITVGLCLVIFVEVLARYIFFTSTAWAEELARYLFIILTFIGAAYACAHHDHIEIDIINQVLEKIPAIKDKKKSQKIVDIIGNVTTIIFLLIFNSIFGNYIAQINKIGLLSPTMQIPMVWIYASVYLGGVLSIIHLIYLVIRDLSGAKSE